MMISTSYSKILALTCFSTFLQTSASTVPINVCQAPAAPGLTNATQHVSRGGSSLCISGTASVAAGTTSNSNFDYDLPLTQAEATQTWLTMWAAGSNFPASIENGTIPVNGTYEIAATLCTPCNGSNSKLQILTHGIGFDHTYWDFAPGYSYVDVATAAGYSTLAYDRLGVGASSKEDPLNTIQSPLEMEILHGLIDQLRQGLYSSIYTTIVGIGHSFGSALTQGITASYPQDLDATILTGWSTNATGMPTFNLGQNPTFAAQNQPYRFSDLNNGYLVVASPIANQQTFFHWPGFDPDILSLADATKATVTVGELFTATATVKEATDFTGPFAVVAGNEDLGFCFGNCSYPSNILAGAAPQLYSNVPGNRTGTYVAKDAGHGLNFHYSAKEAFEWMQTFLQSNGI